MSAVTILPLDRNELQAMLETAIEQAVLTAAIGLAVIDARNTLARNSTIK